MANLQIPGYGGGLTRYNEEYNSNFKLKPSTIIGMVVLTVILELVLHFFI